MSEFNVVRLYWAVMVPICSDWITALDLCSLDTAVCNNTLRPYLLRAMSKCCLLHYKEEDLMEWIAMRGMGVRKWTVEAPLSELDRQILTRSRYLMELNVNKMQNVAEVLDVCPVDAVTIVDSTDEDFLELVPRLACVRSLIMTNSGLTSAINQAIVNHIPYLRELKINQEAAEVIEGCRSLERVALMFCSKVMDALLGLQNLRTLSFYYSTTYIIRDNDLMPLLTNCSALERLVVYNSQLTDAFTASLARLCPRLSVFDMGDSLVSDETLLALAQHCPLLTELGITSNAVTDDGLMAVVEGCPLLSKLCFEHCALLTNDCITSILRSCSRLTFLGVCDNEKFTDAAFCGVFYACPTLKVLEMFGNSLSTDSQSIVFISNFINLECICLDTFTNYLYPVYHNAMEDPPLQMLLNVNLSVSDYHKVFVQSPKLVRFRCMRTDFTYECLTAMIKHCPLLTDLYLKLRSLPFEKCVDAIKAYPKLKQLTIRGSKGLLEQSIENVLGNTMECLTSILFKKCPINDVCLDEIGQYCPSLRRIQVCKIINITGIGVSRLLHKCSMVDVIVLEKCPSVGSEALKTIVELKRKMKEIKFLQCAFVDKDEMVDLTARLSLQVKKLIIPS